MNDFDLQPHAPRHVLLMPDGDRRYARKTHLRHDVVYRRAAGKVVEFIETAFSLSYDIVTVFLTRPETYVAGVQKRGEVNLRAILKAVGELGRILGHKSRTAPRFSCRVVGSLAPPPRVQCSPSIMPEWASMQARLESMVAISPPGPFRRVNLLMNYSGSSSLAAMTLAAKKLNSKGSFQDLMNWELGGAVDLVVRTGDGMRLSDGPSHQMYDAQFVHLPVLFPALTLAEMRQGLLQHKVRQMKR